MLKNVCDDFFNLHFSTVECVKTFEAPPNCLPHDKFAFPLNDF